MKEKNHTHTENKPNVVSGKWFLFLLTSKWSIWTPVELLNFPFYRSLTISFKWIIRISWLKQLEWALERWYGGMEKRTNIIDFDCLLFSFLFIFCMFTTTSNPVSSWQSENFLLAHKNCFYNCCNEKKFLMRKLIRFWEGKSHKNSY